MNNTTAFNITPRLIIGFGILVLGMLWTLDNLDVLESDPITRWWPVVLVLIGIVQLVNRRGSWVGPVVLILFGAGFLLDEGGVIDFDLGDLIPLAIALLGGKLIWEAVTRRPRNAEAIGESDAVIHAFAMMAAVKRKCIAREFRGGDANAIMGGVELDLREAQMRAGEDVILDAFAWWGGVEIRVPQNWRVVGQVLPLMGAFEDNTHPSDAGGPILTIRGTAIMGAIEVKN